MAIHGITAEIFTRNLHDYLSLMESYCGNIVWIGLTATLDMPDFPQRNSVVQLWNKAVYEMLEEFHPNILTVDVWEKSLTSLHVDNIHLDTTSFYDHLGHLFFHLQR